MKERGIEKSESQTLYPTGARLQHDSPLRIPQQTDTRFQAPLDRAIVCRVLPRTGDVGQGLPLTTSGHGYAGLSAPATAANNSQHSIITVRMRQCAIMDGAGLHWSKGGMFRENLVVVGIT
jgi:hypothetical protein